MKFEAKLVSIPGRAKKTTAPCIALTLSTTPVPPISMLRTFNAEPRALHKRSFFSLGQNTRAQVNIEIGGTGVLIVQAGGTVMRAVVFFARPGPASRDHFAKTMYGVGCILLILLDDTKCLHWGSPNVNR